MVKFSKSTKTTRLYTESDENLYEIRIENETGIVSYWANNSRVEKLSVFSYYVKDLLYCWSVLSQNLIAFAMLPLAQIKSKRYTGLFWALTFWLEKFNAGGFNRS